MRETPRLLRTQIASYEVREWWGANTSGCQPVGDHVLVLTDEAASKIGSIHLPEQLSERQSLASESGVIVAIGDGAFRWNADRSHAFAGTKPEVGQRVFFARYSGQVLKGLDEVMYRLMSDSCIGGVAIPVPDPPEGYDAEEGGPAIIDPEVELAARGDGW